MAKKKGGFNMELAYTGKRRKDYLSKEKISEAEAMRRVTGMIRRDVSRPLTNMSFYMMDSILSEINKQIRDSKGK